MVWLPFPPFRRNPKASAARQRSSNHVLWVMLQVLARLLRSVLRGDRQGEGVSLSHTVPQPVYEPIRPTHNGRPWRPVLCYCCNAPAVYRETFASRDREGRTRMRGVCSACSRAARDGRHDRSPYRTRLRQASAPGRTGRNGTPFTQNLTPAPFNLNRVD